MTHETDSDLGLTPADMMSDEQRLAQQKAREQAYEKSKVGDWNVKNGTLLFEVDPGLIETSAIDTRAAQDQAERKNEFHVTLIGYKAGKEITQAIKKLPPDQQASMREKIKELTVNLNQGWATNPEVLRVSKEYPPDPNRPEDQGERRVSYIQLAEFPAMEEFYAQINELLGLHLEPPPTHITLMTGSTKPEHQLEGIGIPDKKTLEQLNPEMVIDKEGEVVDDKK